MPGLFGANNVEAVPAAPYAAIDAWSGTMNTEPDPANSCTAGAMKLSPIRMFLSSSFTSSKPRGITTSTTYLPDGSIGTPAYRSGEGTGSDTQIVQLVPVTVGLPVASTAVTLGNLYAPS